MCVGMTKFFRLCDASVSLLTEQLFVIYVYTCAVCVCACACACACACVCDEGYLPLGSPYCSAVFCTARRALVL